MDGKSGIISASSSRLDHMTVEILLKAQVEGGAGIYLAAHTLDLFEVFLLLLLLLLLLFVPSINHKSKATCFGMNRIQIFFSKGLHGVDKIRFHIHPHTNW